VNTSYALAAHWWAAHWWVDWARQHLVVPSHATMQAWRSVWFEAES
jgi:hypothetical protein